MTQGEASASIASGPPAAHASISAAVVRKLIAQQSPQFAAEEIGERFDGWDMAVFRLGTRLSVRLPRVEAAVTSLATENRWTEYLGAHWDFPHPRVVAQGVPGAGFPWPWSVVTWLPGDTAAVTPLAASAGAELGRALAQVHIPAPDDAPFNIEQSITLAQRADAVAADLATVASHAGPDGEWLNLGAAQALWAQALASSGPGTFVWSHADTHGSNLLSNAGAFAGIIDWGKMAACERAVDLAFLYTAMPAEGVAAALDAYEVATGVDDPGLRARVRGIALSKCVSWATLDRPANVAMAWRGLTQLGVTK